MKLNDIDRVIGGIELYKLRHGHYPDSIGALEFQGNFPITSSAFIYTRLDTGYTLDHVDTMWSKFKFDTALVLPQGYWSGLGCRRSNLMTADSTARSSP